MFELLPASFVSHRLEAGCVGFVFDFFVKFLGSTPKMVPSAQQNEASKDIIQMDMWH